MTHFQLNKMNIHLCWMINTIITNSKHFHYEKKRKFLFFSLKIFFFRSFLLANWDPFGTSMTWRWISPDCNVWLENCSDSDGLAIYYSIDWRQRKRRRKWIDLNEINLIGFIIVIENRTIGPKSIWSRSNASKWVK